jgi:signal transduction histidine kinase
MPMSYFDNSHQPDRATSLKLGIAAICTVMILAIWATVAISIYFSREAAHAAMQADADNLAAAFDDEMTNALDAVFGTMDAVANRMRAKGSDMNIYKWSQEIPIVTGPVMEATIIRPNGMLMASTKAPVINPVDVSDLKHIRIQLDGKFQSLFIGPPVISRVYSQISGVDRWIIPISERVETKDGRFIGVLDFVLSPVQLTKLYKSINLGENGTIALVGLDGVIRARYSKNSPEGLDGIGHSIESAHAMDFYLHNEQGSYAVTSVVDHIHRLYSFKRVPGYPLVVIVGMDYDEGLALWWTNAKVILALAAIATILLGGLALLLTREINRRVIRDIAIVNASKKLLLANTELTEERHKLQAANMELTKERGKLQVSNAKLVESTEKAQVANQAKSLFLANMGHEFRTPLNAIIGFSQIIKDQIMGPGKPIYAEYARDIWGAGEHLLEIINNLLDISKIEAGKTELSEELIDPADIVNASLAAVRIQAENKKIALTADIPPGTPFIRGDALRLRQVLINLVSNAVKFTEAGHVAVSVASNAARGFSFTVADTGIGMTADEIVKALETFGQVDNAIIKKYEGTGLGLPLAQRLVELHGGRLVIESVKGAGTTVRACLPAERILLTHTGAAA